MAAFGLLQSFVNPVLPTIQRDLHTTQAHVTWVMTAYLLSASVCTPIVGRVGDIVGKNRVFVLTLLALALGSLLAALAPNIAVMVVARCIQGIGGGALPLSFGIIRDELPPERVPGAVGTAAAVVAAGGGLGLVLAGPIVDTLGYHWLFWIPFVMVTLAAVAAHIVVPDSPVRAPGRLDWAAALLLSVALVALLLGITEGPSSGWTSARVVGFFALAVTAALLWSRAELRSVRPLIDLRTMALPAVWTTNLVAFLFGAGMYASMAFLPQYLQTPPSSGYGFGASIARSGLFLLPQAVCLIALGLAAGGLSRWLGSRVVLLIGCGITAVPFVIMAGAPRDGWVVLLASALFGIGPGLGFSAMSTIVVQAVPAHQTGVATGMNANIRTMGGALGSAVMASVVTSTVVAGGFPSRAGYQAGFGVLAGAALLSFAAAFAVPRSAQRSATDTADSAELALIASGPIAMPLALDAALEP